ncbi:MAG: tRNA (adenosine(37)-N6)-threonylcarbamoyltransferase complex ATPase subunit type 1 TsaE [Lachnospiraceae bacterium]|nr:tRNA (adenosine(37)-N6)-threonylcarbamoyltransferase complex ATPase subunit type 1 TsaE [Lachnospiraceae bacterium]MBQ6363356.1 tRNA (adenosine(37)-N6)-threonylcarbamoyltransferase complex ATPase subunit type 1 TsaE [Lachnospiraceae bacterium]
MIIESFSAQDTFEAGRRLAESASAGEIYALHGDLGVGKTVFTKGFAEGLGITEPVCSPTFTILQIYEEGRLPLYHFDVYRIEEPEEMEEVGLDEYLFGEGVCLIEWADRIEDMIPDTARRIVIEKDLSKGLDYRRITVI